MKAGVEGGRGGRRLFLSKYPGIGMEKFDRGRTGVGLYPKLLTLSKQIKFPAKKVSR
jgi:hypothetical protein